MFASDFYLVVQFTQCASILSAAGMLLFAHAVVDCRAPKGTRNDVIVVGLGVVLLLWGSVMRWQAFLMGMPFFCVGLLFNLKQCWKSKRVTVAGLAVIFAGAYAMHHFDASLYKNAEYAPYVDVQEPRAFLGEANYFNQNAAYEDLEEMGKSGVDYHMLTEWVFYDTETFVADSMRAFANVITHYRDKNEWGNIPHQLLNALGHSLQSPLFWTWFIFCLLTWATNRQKFLYLWASLGVILCLMTILLAMSRLVYRVESGFWLYAAVLAIPLWGRFRYELPRKLGITIVAVIALANVFTYATNGELVRGPGTGELRTLAVKDSTDYDQVFAYIDSQPNKMFLLSMNAYMRFSHHKNPPYLAEPIGSYRRTVSFGYWTPYLPEITQALAEFGITNPIKDVVHDNVIVINEGRLTDFLQRHYYDSVAVDTLKEIGEMTFFKYRLIQADSAAKEAE
jgi:fucose 4-O-acetylase-like acetyltransferase